MSFYAWDLLFFGKLMRNHNAFSTRVRGDGSYTRTTAKKIIYYDDVQLQER